MKRRNSTNKRRASRKSKHYASKKNSPFPRASKRGSSPKKKQKIRASPRKNRASVSPRSNRKSVGGRAGTSALQISPRRNPVSVGGRAGTSGLQNSPRRSFSPERSFYPDSLNGTAFYADHSFTPRRNSFSRRRRSSFGAPKQSSVRKNAARRSQLFRTGGQLLSPIIEDRQMSPISRVPRDLSVYPDSLDNTLIPQRLVPLIDNSQQFIDQYRTYDDLDGSFEQDSLNPVLLASRTETSPINNLSNDPDRTMRLSPNRSLQLSPNDSDRTIRLSPNRSLRLSPNDSDRTMRLSPNRSLRLSPNPNVNSRRRTIKLRKQDPNFVTRDERPDAIDLGLEVPSLDTDPSVINEVATMMRQAHLRDDFDPDNFVDLGFSEGLLSAALQLSYDILSESDKRQIREVQLKKKKRLIEREADKLSKEMGVELINKKKVDMNKYRGIPSDVLAKAYKKALNKRCQREGQAGYEVQAGEVHEVVVSTVSGLDQRTEGRSKDTGSRKLERTSNSN